MKATDDSCDCMSSGAFACEEWNAGFPGQNWPAECLSVVTVREDEWKPININFWQENVVPSLEPVVYTGTEDITVRIMVWWGILDISGRPDVDINGNAIDETAVPPISPRFSVEGVAANIRCKKTPMLDLNAAPPSEDQECVVCDDASEHKCSDLLPMLTQLQKNVNYVKYEYKAETAKSAKERVLVFRGQYTDVYATLGIVKYKPEKNQNYLRLKSRYLSSATAQKAPFEKMVIQLLVDDPTGWEPIKPGGKWRYGNYHYPNTPVVVSEVTQTMHIEDVNNPPELENPANTYSASPLCSSDPLATLGECHFGQFFRLEDTFKTLDVKGVSGSDVDLWETCSYNFPECTKVDVNVVTLKGSTGLNTRVGLNVYQDKRSALGFGSYLQQVNAAIQVLAYQVELQERAGTALSTVLNYNTQHSQNEEYITVTLSDQGSTGAEGVSQIATTRIPITIIAVNDDPIITSAELEYAISEDRPSELTGNVIADVDLGEKIVSSLADLEWLKASESANIINMITLTVAVKRGVLYLSYLRNIQLNFTHTSCFLTVTPYRPNFPDGDFCVLDRGFNLGKMAYSPLQDSTTYRDVCSLLNVGTDACPTGDEEQCLCNGEPACINGAKSLLMFNRSRPGWGNFRWNTVQHIASVNRTCGGLPQMKAPNNYSFAKDCSDCLSGMPCNTCAQKNLVKCHHFDMRYLTGELAWDANTDRALYQAGQAESAMYPEHCSNGFQDDGTSRGQNFQSNPDLDPIYIDFGETGVDTGGPCWPKMPVRACRCCANISFACTADSDCRDFWNGNVFSPCGCSPHGDDGPIVDGIGTPFTAPGHCGPYRDMASGQGEELMGFKSDVQLMGVPCTYTGTGADICKSATFAQDGTQVIRYIEDLGEGGDGSKTISVFGLLVDINRALEGVRYLGDLHYNRLYRIPVEQRDAATFKIESDDLDQLDIFVSDNGNSGGEARDIKTATNVINIRVAAVNDPPEIDAPSFVQAVEDVPYRFDTSKLPVSRGGAGGPIITCPEPNERFAIYGRLIYNCLPVQILDPDLEDYGFADKPMRLTLQALNGSLFLDEDFLKLAEIRKKNHAGSKTVSCSDCRLTVARENCCKCNADLQGCKITYHISGRDWFLDRKIRPAGLHTIGGPEFGVGNQFLSIEGTYAELNKALLGLTYKSHPNFNTRYGIKEQIRIDVNDLGNMGEVYFQTKHLTASWVIDVLVDSVNDPPELGRLLPVIDVIDGVLDTDPQQEKASDVIFPLDDTINEIDQCYTLSVTSVEYRHLCSPQPLDMKDRETIRTASYRRYIDIDEDTPFSIRPDVFWIEDVDADEALQISRLKKDDGSPQPRRYFCGGENVEQVYEDRGCFCGQACICGPRICDCPAPSICFDDMTPEPGYLIVEIGAKEGLLSLYPPPGRVFIDGLEFLTNVTQESIENCVNSEASRKSMAADLFTLTQCAVPCSDQVACMRNQSRLMLRTKKLAIQEALRKAYITYSGQPDGVGTGGGLDTLRIWVSDQGMTDERYLSNKALLDGSVSGEVGVRVVAVNDAPTITYPSNRLTYTQTDRCQVDILSDVHQNGVDCYREPELRIPPAGDNAPSIFISDWDLDDVPYGNLTLTLRIGKPNAGNFQFLGKGVETLISDVSFLIFSDDQGLLTLALAGPRDSINKGLAALHYDSNPTFNGYVPIKVTADDNGNYGECSGEHECGQSKPCLNHRIADPHTAEKRGRSTEIIGVMVGGKGFCVVDCDGGPDCCEKCNMIQTDNCAWCSGDCGGQGKCMLAAPGRSKPLFSKCPPNERDGRKFGQCVVKTANMMPTILGSALSVVVAAVVAWRLLLWVRRRHGSVVQYLKKKRTDVFISAQRLHLNPPREARYPECFLVLVLLGVHVLYLANIFDVSEPSCQFTDGFFLDRAKSIVLQLDTCELRFLPSHLASGVDQQITSPKVLFSYTQNDADVVLEADTCGDTATMKIENARSDMRRYSGYYCTVLFMVPSQVVLPNIRIEALGSNVTSVRGGSMDRDTPNFGIDLGPNVLAIKGAFMDVRLQNISARELDIDIKHGNLLATDLGLMSVISKANFQSVSANLIVTTTQRTSMRYWQKSGNKVCVTGAKGSVYLSDACEESCSLIDASKKPQPVTPSPPPDKCPSLTRYPCPRCQRNKISTIPGCVDLKRCTEQDSLQCLCKPACEMVDLETHATKSPLDGSVISPIAARCNAAGSCCLTFCYGYSKADVFPDPDQPQCGVCVNPTTKPWDKGDLDQKWTFTSETGQISLQSLRTPQTESVSSYKSSQTARTVNATQEIVTKDKDTLDAAFHAEGAAVPVVPWFALQIFGPGAPEVVDGEFIWLSSAQYLVIPGWITDIFASFLIKPDRGGVAVRIDPGFCPAVAPSAAERTKRQIQLRALLLDALQTWPPEEESRILPPTSLVLYRPTNGTAKVFNLDPATNQIAIRWVGQQMTRVRMCKAYLNTDRFESQPA